MSAPADALRVEPLDGGAGIALHGELTYATAAGFADQVDITGAATTGLVIDVAGLQFCDSAGLAALIGLERRVRRAGGAVALRGAQHPLRRLLRLTGVDVLFACVEGEDHEAGAESG